MLFTEKKIGLKYFVQASHWGDQELTQGHEMS